MIAIICILVMRIVLALGALGVALPSALSGIFQVTGEVLIWISTVFTIISGVVYVAQNKQFISQK